MEWLHKPIEKLLINIAELLKVKTLITLLILGALTYMFIKEGVPVELFAAIAGSVVTYYFQRKENDNV
jgi:positive regulator of sigma E activity